MLENAVLPMSGQGELKVCAQDRVRLLNSHGENFDQAASYEEGSQTYRLAVVSGELAVVLVHQQ